MMTRWQRDAIAGSVLLSLAILTSGCEGAGWFRKKEPPVEPTPEALSEQDAVTRNTISTIAALGNAAPVMIKGFGLVVGLDGGGSREVASSVRKYLEDELKKLKASQEWYYGAADFSIDELIESEDTAVVELTAYVQPGMCEGATFDVSVTAASGTQTLSLEGGLLLLAKLRLVGVSSSVQGIITGRDVAVARGPVFTSPFAGQGGGPLSDPRTGLVLGGGLLTEERPFKFLVLRPSYPVARRLEQRVNERFGFKPPVAEAVTPGEVVVHTPRTFAETPLEFARVASRVYLDNSPAFREAKLRELSTLNSQPDADFESISYAWQAIGPGAISRAQAFYTDSNADRSFSAARAGIRLGDGLAAPVLAQMARDEDNPYRLHAVKELVRSQAPMVSTHLLPLLDDADPEVRVAAYRGLLESAHPAVRSLVFGHRQDGRYANLSLDVVDSEARPIVYATRSQSPHIALFRREMPLTTPLFYAEEGGDLTINAEAGADEVKILGRVTANGPLEEFVIRPRVDELIRVLGDRPDPNRHGRPSGLGFCYARVLRVLSAMSESGAVPAPLVFERVSLRELFGPREGRERREADTQTLEEYEASLRSQQDESSEEEPPGGAE